MSFDPQAIAMLRAANDSYASARASTGEYEWPPEGTHDCILRGVNLKVSESTYNNVKVPITLVSFEYEWMPIEGAHGYDPDRTEPLTWRGASIRILPGYDKNPNLKDGQKTGFRIDEERFKGACTVILRKSEKECVDAVADITAIQAAIDAGTVQVGVNVRHRKFKNRDGQDVTARTDQIRDRLS